MTERGEIPTPVMRLRAVASPPERVESEVIQCVDLRTRTAFVIVKTGNVEHHVFVLIRVHAHSDRQKPSRLEAYIKHGRGFYRFQ